MKGSFVVLMYMMNIRKSYHKPLLLISKVQHDGI